MYVYCISALNGPMVLIRPLKKSRAVKMNTNRWKYYSLSCLGGCSGRSRWRALKWRQSRPRLICHVLIWMLHLSGKFVACSKPFEWRQSLTRSAPAPHTSKRPILASRLWGFDGHFWRLLLCQLGQVMKQRVTFEWLVFIRPASAGPITQSAALCSSPPSGDDEGINYWKGETGCSIPPPPLSTSKAVHPPDWWLKRASYQRCKHFISAASAASMGERRQSARISAAVQLWADRADYSCRYRDHHRDLFHGWGEGEGRGGSARVITRSAISLADVIESAPPNWKPIANCVLSDWFIFYCLEAWIDFWFDFVL